MKEQLVRTIDYTNVLYADITIGVVTLLLGLILWKNKTYRWPLIVLGLLYLTFTLLWHNSYV